MAENDGTTIAERAKELLAEPRHRIAFDDFVNEHLRIALDKLSPEHFPLSGNLTNGDLVKRLAAYEDAVHDLLDIVILTARWGDAEGQNQLEKILLRLTETVPSAGGLTILVNLRWYPLAVLIYAAGIAALSGRRFDVLRVVFTPLLHLESYPTSQALINAVMSPLVEIDQNFRVLPGRDRDRFPRSEHLLAILRKPFDRLLFLGASLEPLFDRFEVLLALAFADLRDPKGEGDAWGPFGRFVYKQRRSNSPMNTLIEEAAAAGSNWPLLASGLFGGQSAHFLQVAETYRQLINRSAAG
jgi:hypothetical protein